MKKEAAYAVIAALILAVASVISACGPEMATPTTRPLATENPAVEPTGAGAAVRATPVPGATVTASGLQYVEVLKGDGPVPKEGEIVSVHYQGTLEDGTEFDNSYTRGQPFSFALGRGMVIPGWDEGIGLMNVGGKAKLIIPPELAYGSSGAGSVIPPHATLIFDVELVEILPGAPDAPREVAAADYVTTDSGLQYHDFVVGEGASPEAGKQVAVHYTGWLQDGTKFDSSLDRGQPFVFALGVGSVIQGWDVGVAGMKVGGQRQLVIPPELGYGEQGAGSVIPPNATLVFEVELLDVEP